MPGAMPPTPSNPKFLLFIKLINWIFLLNNKILLKDSELFFVRFKFVKFIFFNWYKFLHEVKNDVIFSSVDIFDIFNFNKAG